MNGSLPLEAADRWAIVAARVALGSSFLSGIADRFGLWPARYEGYGNFAGFLRYTAKVNAFMPSWTIPYLGWAATVGEFTLGVALLVGCWLRWVSVASAVLLALFGTAMALSFGLKSSLDYSVFSAAAAAIMLAVFAGRRRRPSDLVERGHED
jgi:putative oxidoreductase